MKICKLPNHAYMYLSIFFFSFSVCFQPQQLLISLRGYDKRIHYNINYYIHCKESCTRNDSIFPNVCIGKRLKNERAHENGSRVYHLHHCRRKGCALHTIIFIIQYRTRNMLEKTRLFNAHVYQTQYKYLFGNEACARIKRENRRKKKTYAERNLTEGLKSLITRKICALKIKSDESCRAIWEQCLESIDVHWLFWLVLIPTKKNCMQRTSHEKRPKQFSNNIPNWCYNSIAIWITISLCYLISCFA